MTKNTLEKKWECGECHEMITEADMLSGKHICHSKEQTFEERWRKTEAGNSWDVGRYEDEILSFFKTEVSELLEQGKELDRENEDSLADSEDYRRGVNDFAILTKQRFGL